MRSIDWSGYAPFPAPSTMFTKIGAGLFLTLGFGPRKEEILTA